MSMVQDPNGILDWSIDWSAWLVDGDVIAESTWACSDETIVIDRMTFTDNATVCWVSGGTIGTTVTLTNHVVCESGRADDRSLTLRIKQR